MSNKMNAVLLELQTLAIVSRDFSFLLSDAFFLPRANV
jgi:hypothetical protein